VKIKKIFLFFIFSIFILNAYPLDSVDLLSGYFGVGKKDLEETEATYEGVPLFLSLNYNITPFFEKIGIKQRGKFYFLIEPFINTVIEPNSNIETGVDFLFKYSYPIIDYFNIYIKGGTGASFMSLHTKEQSTQYNFVSQAGLGFSFNITKNILFNLEYRYRHLSNASIKHPNNGINSDFILGGFTFLFNDKKS